MTASQLESAVTGDDLQTYAYSDDADAYVQLGWNDPIIANGPGEDLYIFGLGNEDFPDYVQIAVNINIWGAWQTYLMEDTGFDVTETDAYGTYTWDVLVAKVDLSDFTPPVEDAAIVRIGVSLPDAAGYTVALAAAGSFNTVGGTDPTEAVPEPASIALFSMGILGLMAYRKRMKA
jgi:hypothetical protein